MGCVLGLRYEEDGCSNNYHRYRNAYSRSSPRHGQAYVKLPIHPTTFSKTTPHHTTSNPTQPSPPLPFQQPPPAKHSTAPQNNDTKPHLSRKNAQSSGSDAHTSFPENMELNWIVTTKCWCCMFKEGRASSKTTIGTSGARASERASQQGDGLLAGMETEASMGTGAADGVW